MVDTDTERANDRFSMMLEHNGVSFTIETAWPSDVPAIMRVIQTRIDWLKQRGSQQW